MLSCMTSLTQMSCYDGIYKRILSTQPALSRQSRCTGRLDSALVCPTPHPEEPTEATPCSGPRAARRAARYAQDWSVCRPAPSLGLPKQSRCGYVYQCHGVLWARECICNKKMRRLDKAAGCHVHTLRWSSSRPRSRRHPSRRASRRGHRQGQWRS